LIDKILKFKSQIFIVIVLVLFLAAFIGVCRNPNGPQSISFLSRQDSPLYADTIAVMLLISNGDALYTAKEPIVLADKNFQYYSYPVANYPPFSYIFLYPIYKAINSFIWEKEIEVEKIWSIFLYVGLFVAILFAIFFVQLYDLKEGDKAIKFFTALSLFCSATALYAYKTANVVIFSTILITFFIVNYRSKNKIIHEFALIALACAANLKMIPCIFGILLLYDKQYKPAIKVVIYAIILLIVPFLFLANEQYSALDSFIAFFNIIFAWTDGSVNILSELGGRHTNIFGLEGQILIEKVTNAILMIMAVISLITGYFLKVQWKKIALTTMCFIVFTKGGVPYILLIVLPVIIMFLNEKENNYERSQKQHLCRLDILYLIGFIVFANPFQIRPYGFGLTAFLAKAALTGIFILLFYESIVAFLDYRKSYKNKKIKI
jgi:hypothetical protein